MLALGLVCASCFAAHRAQGENLTAEVRAQVDAGKDLFATTCANCHGSGGKGAIGPALVDRNLSLDSLRSTILNGRVGTPMPPFKDELDAKSQAAVIAYAEWLTSGGRLPSEPVSSEGSAVSAALIPSAQPIPVGMEKGTPARGASLFFDPTRMSSCRLCHSYANKGGPVGPDLIGSGKNAEQIYSCIARPKVAAADYPGVALEMRDGIRMLGVKVGETPDAIIVFDVSSLPPVKRTVVKSDVARTTAVVDSGIYDHTALPFSKQDRLDLSAYLGKSGPSAPAK
jgi:cytochrome c55X